MIFGPKLNKNQLPSVANAHIDDRKGLPGVQAENRTHMENIWKRKCTQEREFKEMCRNQPAHTEDDYFGKIRGYEVVKYPSYVDIRLHVDSSSMVGSQASRLSRSGASQLSRTGTYLGSRCSRASHHSSTPSLASLAYKPSDVLSRARSTASLGDEAGSIASSRRQDMSEYSDSMAMTLSKTNQGPRPWR
mmetsp:Transcript_4697/g.8557  ORF Transcript_4697/g.8557 Transcript_4697/m.8557 type:complete len:190 (-) Transcript_4697:102-671(-)